MDVEKETLHHAGLVSITSLHAPKTKPLPVSPWFCPGLLSNIFYLDSRL